MPNPWFRAYAEFATDIEVQTMPEALQRRLIMLMCMRCGNDKEAFQDDEVMFVLRIGSEELAETKTVFQGKGFIGDGWRLLNWEKRQYVSNVSTPRVQAHRKRNVSETPKETLHETDQGVPETFHETPRNVSGTPPDTDTDTDKIKILPADERQAAATIDPRHAACRDHVHAYWKHRHPGDTQAPWDGGEGKALAKLLKAKPDLSPERFRQLLGCRDRSEVNHGERPRAWLERLTDYAGGPLDRFKIPCGTSPPDVALYWETRIRSPAEEAGLRAQIAAGEQRLDDPQRREELEANTEAMLRDRLRRGTQLQPGERNFLRERDRKRKEVVSA